MGIQKIKPWAWVVLSGALYSWVAYGVDRSDTWSLQACFLGLFLAYVWGLRRRSSPSFRHILMVGLLLRLVLFFPLPTLSNDVYRFLWDGLLWHEGLNPYNATPSQYLREGLPAFFSPLYEALNSKDYHTVYPLWNQSLFFLSTLGYHQPLQAVWVMRLLHLLPDLGIAYLLWRLLAGQQKPLHGLGVYFWNPLVLLEGMGNLHYEVWMLFFLLLGIFAWTRRQALGTGLALAFATATKIFPLMFLLSFLTQGHPAQGHLTQTKAWAMRVRLLGVFTLSTGLLFLPMFSQFRWQGLSESLGLYFHTFEFNASVYFLLNMLGAWWKGYSLIASIGPALALGTGLGILVFVFFGRRRPPQELCMHMLFFYLLGSTTVHPWYVLPLLGLCVLSGALFPILWSYTVLWSYTGYSPEAYSHPYALIACEYVIVGIAYIYEMRQGYAQTWLFNTQNIQKDD